MLMKKYLWMFFFIVEGKLSKLVVEAAQEEEMMILKEVLE